MKIVLFENYKFTNLSGGGGGGQAHPPGYIETNKLRGLIKELGGGGSIPPNLPGNSHPDYLLDICHPLIYNV